MENRLQEPVFIHPESCGLQSAALRTPGPGAASLASSRSLRKLSAAETHLMEFLSSQAWYHGSPHKLDILRKGSTITQKRELDPQTTMAPGDDWLTTRELHVQLLCPTEVKSSEQLTDEEYTELQKRLVEKG